MAIDWSNIETFGGEVVEVDEEGFLQVFGPDREPLFSADAAQLLDALILWKAGAQDYDKELQ